MNHLLWKCLLRVPLDAELSHLSLLKCLGAMSPLLPVLGRATEPIHAMGLEFPNVIGCAAGFDKDALCVEALARLGFGHVEVGTITPRPQYGNPKPRVTRLTDEEGIVNAFGFASQGLERVRERLELLHQRRVEGTCPRFIMGISAGKNADTALADAWEDYVRVIEETAHLGDYWAINVSSPNTAGLRNIPIGELLRNIERSVGKEIPLVLKVSPDSEHLRNEVILPALACTSVRGIIATNTTTMHSCLQKGGLSGQPLRAKSTAVLQQVSDILKDEGRSNDVSLIGVGGVNCGEAAREKLHAGASLVQLYSALAFRGPWIARDILNDM